MTHKGTSPNVPNKEETLQTNEQHIHTLNTILAASTEFISMLDRQGRYLYASENIATLFGLKPSDLLGKTWREAGLSVEFLVPFDVQHQKVMTTGQTVMAEMLFPGDTQMRWFNYVASPVVDAHGEVESVVVSWIDITERKQVEDATYRLASIVESSGDAIFSKTLQGVITSWNSGAEIFYGYTADEMMGKSDSLLIPPDRQNEMREILALIAVGETVKNHETTWMRKDGTLRDMSITMSPIRDATGKIIGASTIAHDITKYKHMVEELATRSGQLEGTVEELATRSRQLEGSNQELATRSRELEGSNDELATRSRQLERSNDKLVTRSRQLERSNDELATRSSELEGSNQDLGRQRDELTSLTSVNANLEEANQVRSQFLSTMSHELRTPLASIIGFSQLLLDHGAKADWKQQQRNDLERILKNGQHLLGLINDVLDLSKTEAGRMVLNYSHVDVRELLISVVEEIQSIAIARHLVLRADIEDGVDLLESDRQKLHQILLNLVSNALKFTEQGEVTVSARRVISSDLEADRLALAVHDTGKGIPADLHAQVFEPFYQVDGSYTRKVGGTGLGLAIVSQLTTLLGGTIELTSAPGQGSTFTVLLPIKLAHRPVEQDIPRLLSSPSQNIPSPPASYPDIKPKNLEEIFAVSTFQETPGGQKQVILAVDDNPDVIHLIEAALNDTLYTVVGVQDPSQVIQLVQELHPRAITLDVMMPEINGWQLLYQLKANPATSSVPVVMLSVLAESTTGYLLGAEAYLIKPFQTEVMLDTIQRVITAQSDTAQTSKHEIQPA